MFPKHYICSLKYLLLLFLTSNIYHLSSVCPFPADTVIILNVKEILVLFCMTCGSLTKPSRYVIYPYLCLLLESLSCMA